MPASPPPIGMGCGGLRRGWPAPERRFPGFIHSTQRQVVCSLPWSAFLIPLVVATVT